MFGYSGLTGGCNLYLVTFQGLSASPNIQQTIMQLKYVALVVLTARLYFGGSAIQIHLDVRQFSLPLVGMKYQTEQQSISPT